jgi:preprotein translocase subunit SecG
MGFIIGVLTVVLVLDCLFLMLLILMQLPKKEAGVGTAFGGAATDALFGSGGGNVLTKVTKYAAAMFFLLAFSLSIAGSHRAHVGDRSFREALQTQAASGTAPQPAPASGSSNMLQSLTLGSNQISSAASNTVIEGKKPATNAPTAPPK